MPTFEFGGTLPYLPEDAWVAPNAVLTGNVCLARCTSVWFGAVLRGDNGPVRVGEGSNVQDLCVLHSEPGLPVIVGRSCSIGHGAMLHGCSIGDDCLIGMGAIILDGARIGDNCIIGAGTLITRDKIIPNNSMVVGTPGRVIRQLGDQDADAQRRKASGYEAKWRIAAARHAVYEQGAA